MTKLEQAARQALGLLEKIHSNPQSAWNCLTEITALHATLEEVPQPAALEQESAWIANDWSVFNTGAEVASGLSLNEAMDYLTDERAARGWSVVCVINKDNMPTPAAPQPLTEGELDLILQKSPIKANYADLTALVRAVEKAHGIWGAA